MLCLDNMFNVMIVFRKLHIYESSTASSYILCVPFDGSLVFRRLHSSESSIASKYSNDI